MGTERMSCCGGLTRVYGDAGHRQHLPGCPTALTAPVIFGTIWHERDTTKESTMTGYTEQETRPVIPARDELNISPATAEKLEAIDEQEDGDTLAVALEAAMLALVDISGDDPNRPRVSHPGKVARRALTRVLEILEA